MPPLPTSTDEPFTPPTTSAVAKEDAPPFRLKKGELLGCRGFDRVYMGMNFDSGELLAVKQILSGGDSKINEDSSKSPATKYVYLRKQEHGSLQSVTRERVDQLLNNFAQKLDPIDWQTQEPYLWENEKKSYLSLCKWGTLTEDWF